MDDRRLIEDYLPIQEISAEASREKSVRKGHISTLHLWWARRPLVACRAAVYGALVPADQWVQGVEPKSPESESQMNRRTPKIAIAIAYNRGTQYPIGGHNRNRGTQYRYNATPS
jgi:adenine-specific DNA methylase